MFKWSLLDTALLAVIFYHLAQAPYTKVEESFTLQAIHDILEYGVFDISRYDHLQFPGVVPRSFIGPLIVAVLSKPAIMISSMLNLFTDDTQMHAQLIVRGVIGLVNGLSLIMLKNALQSLFDEIEEKKNKKLEKDGETPANTVTMTSVGSWFLLFCMTSFHMMFYSSRTLPNFVGAFPLSNIALSLALKGNLEWAILLLSGSAVIFRLELGGLAAGLTIFGFIFKKVDIFRALKFGFMGAGIAIGISMSIDSYFWGDWGIPEVDAFIFNVVYGKSAQWGTESPLAYFTNYLRMLFLPPTVLVLNYIGYRAAPKNLKIVTLAGYFHILAMSTQPHKEWRFIIYSVPPIIMLGSAGAAYLWENFKVRTMGNAALLALLPLSVAIGGVVSYIFCYISTMNYPGVEALAMFNDYVMANNVTNSTVFITVPPCMTGVSLFGQLDFDKYGITYDRTEDSKSVQNKWDSYDYMITHESLDIGKSFGIEDPSASKWELIGKSKIFAGVNPAPLTDYIFKEGNNVFSLVKDVIMRESPYDFMFAMLDNCLIRQDLFFIHKRIRNDADENLQ